MIISETDYLAHFGILRKSGRYPWGSGRTQNIRNRSFLDYVDEMRSQGLSDVDICRGLDIKDDEGNISTTQLRAAKTVAKNQQKRAEINFAQRLKDKGLSNVAIGERMHRNESSVRALLAPGAKDRSDLLTATSEMLKRQVEEKKIIDIGSGVENYLDVSKDKLNVAVFMLKEQGYQVHPVKIPQLGTTFDTQVKTLTAPGTTWGQAQKMRFEIKQITEFSSDGGRTFTPIFPPISIHPDRVSVNYKETGGDEADGIIYVRPGIEDISLGGSHYSQVRIKVGDTHFLKGMAIYNDDLPKGTDLLFNTKKEDKGDKFLAMKELSDDPLLPFESVIRQIVADPKTDKARVTSAMNLVNEEGDWTDWGRNFSAQFLSKQPRSVAKEQLEMTYERRKNEFDEISSLTNPTVKKKLLETFADGTDAAAVHLKAASFRNSNWQVILPIASIKPTQVYAPGYENGEKVVLIRYPHGGTFEIPELIVNNKHPEAKKLLGDSQDAIGIHHSVAQRMSGADFDGDTVLVIPNNASKIKHSHALEELMTFDPIASYPRYDGMTVMTKTRKAQEMGNVSNLITDMTIKGASHAEISRAVRHSMVVIDAEKHELNYKQSAIDFGIKDLKQEYQGGSTHGAATLISRKKSEVPMPERKPRLQAEGGPIDRLTGRKVYVETGAKKINKKGELVDKTQRVNKLADTDDAHTLSSDTLIENLYADHSNKLKALANRARLDALNTPPLKQSISSKKHYAEEVKTLDSKLFIAKSNRPRERQAQTIANASVKARRDANPNLEKSTIKKLNFQALEEARTRMGAKKELIAITSKEWDAIQAGAISNHRLTEILQNTDIELVRKLATPRVELLMTTAKTQRAQSMLSDGYTRAEVAKHLGVSMTTLERTLTGESDD